MFSRYNIIFDCFLCPFQYWNSTNFDLSKNPPPYIPILLPMAWNIKDKSHLNVVNLTTVGRDYDKIASLLELEQSWESFY